MAYRIWAGTLDVAGLVRWGRGNAYIGQCRPSILDPVTTKVGVGTLNDVPVEQTTLLGFVDSPSNDVLGVDHVDAIFRGAGLDVDDNRYGTHCLTDSPVDALLFVLKN